MIVETSKQNLAGILLNILSIYKNFCYCMLAGSLNFQYVNSFNIQII